MDRQPYTVLKNLSVPMLPASLYSLLFGIPAVLIIGGSYLLVWGTNGFNPGIHIISQNMLPSILILILAIFLHELIHGLCWAWCGHKSFKTISYGFNFKSLSPFAHCSEPLEARTYRLGAMLPGLLLGIVPSLISLVSGSGILLIFGLLFTVSAGGDVLILWLLRHEAPTALVLDHPTDAGCYLVKPAGSPQPETVHKTEGEAI